MMRRALFAILALVAACTAPTPAPHKLGIGVRAGQATEGAIAELTQPSTSTDVTPSDSTDLTGLCTKGMWVGTAGNLSLKLLNDGSAHTYKNVPSGTYVPGNVIRAMAATTAQDIECFSGLD